MRTDAINLLREDGAHALRRISPDAFENKRVLVTGASGLIGTHFIAGLVEMQRHTRVQIDAMVHSTIPEHLMALSENADVHFVTGDLCDSETRNSLPLADVILHAATYGQPGLFAAQPTNTLRLNTEGTFALLDHLRPGGKFLFVSSSELYSGLTNPPFAEDQIGTTNTDHSRSCYIEGKRAGEAICMAYRSRSIDAKAARLALAYGPGTRAGDQRVLNSFIERAILTGAIHLLDRGLARRTYCYVRDAVEMMWHIVLQGRSPIYNVGGISATTIANLAQRIAQQVGVSVTMPPSNNETLAGAPADVRLNLCRYEKEFGRMDFLGLEEGLARTIRWQNDFVYRERVLRTLSV